MSDAPLSGVTLKKNRTKGDRLVSILTFESLRKVTFKPKPLPEDVSTYSFVAAEADLAGAFASLGLTNIQLPTSIPVRVVVDITGEGANILRTDDHVRKAIERLAAELIAASTLGTELAKLLQTADGAATDDDKKTFALVTVDQQVGWLEVKIQTDLRNRVEAYPAYLALAKKRVRAWEVKCGASIGLSAVVIVGGAVVTGLTWGAAGPAAVVGLARSSVQLAHTIFDLAADIDRIGWVVQRQLAGLQAVMTSTREGEGEAAKRSNSAKNAALGAASGLLGAKSIPTVGNCKDYLGTYDVKRLQLDLELGKLGPRIFPLEAGIDALTTDVATFTGEDRAELQKFLTAATAQLETLRSTVTRLDEASRMAARNHEKWSAALDEIEVHGWTDKVATLVGAITDLGLAMGGAAPDGVMVGIAAMTSLAATCDDVVKDKAYDQAQKL